jgi:hypothetical protein
LNSDCSITPTRDVDKEASPVIAKEQMNHTPSSTTAESEAFAYLVLNEQARNKFGPASLSFYMSRGLFQKYESFEEFAQRENIPIENLVTMIHNYNEAIEKGGPDEFGKTVFPVNNAVNDPIYVAKVR